MGYAVPDGSFEASVHSVFQSALNLRLDNGTGLLTLLVSGEGDLPQGLRLDTPDNFSFESFNIGERVVCTERLLHFESSSLTVQLSGARLWKCDLPALEFDGADPAVSAAWSSVWEALNRRQKRSGAEIVARDLFSLGNSTQTVVSRKSGEAVRDLLDATQRSTLKDDSSVRALIGLGSGLTPSGDDLLAGYVAGLWCSVRDKSERAQFIAVLGETIIRLSHKTNDISRTYLYHAVRGQVGSRLANLAESICRGEDPERLLDLAEAAMRIGHSSGMDTVTGLLLGLLAWEGSFQDHNFPENL